MGGWVGVGGDGNQPKIYVFRNIAIYIYVDGILKSLRIFFLRKKMR